MTLPPGWTEGLTPRQVRAVVRLEGRADRGIFPRIRPTGKGYAQVYLGRFHPYANASGCQLLHRYVMMRELGRVLEHYEHVHHLPGVPRDTTDPGDLRLCEAMEHDRYHYGVRMQCGREVEVWRPRDERGRWTPYPTDERLAAIWQRVEEELWERRQRTMP